MIDYTRITSGECDIDYIAKGIKEDAVTTYNYNTQELYRYRKYHHKGLEIKLTEPSETNPNGTVTVSGSLHKYWNDGRHNFDDFSLSDCCAAIDRLSNYLQSDLYDFKLNQLELGVNIETDLDPEEVLSNFLFHHSKPFKDKATPRHGNYRVAAYEHYEVKAYDKRLQYEPKGYYFDTNVIRYEVKYSSMGKLKQPNIFYLKDVFEHDPEWIHASLLSTFDDIMYYDKASIPNRSLQVKYGSLKYWTDLKRENRNKYKYERKKFRSMISSHPENQKAIIRKLIQDKLSELSMKDPVLGSNIFL